MFGAHCPRMCLTCFEIKRWSDWRGCWQKGVTKVIAIQNEVTGGGGWLQEVVA